MHYITTRIWWAVKWPCAMWITNSLVWMNISQRATDVSCWSCAIGEDKYSKRIMDRSVGVRFERYDGLKWKSSQLYRDGEYNRSMNICTVFHLLALVFASFLKVVGQVSLCWLLPAVELRVGRQISYHALWEKMERGVCGTRLLDAGAI